MRSRGADDRLYGLEVRDLGARGEDGREPARTAPCIVCGEAPARPRFAVDGWEAPVVVCGSCGLGWIDPLPSPDQVAGFYPTSYYGDPGRKFHPLVERLVRWVGARHIGFLARELRKGDRVLDVGCGRGVILGPLADRGFEVHGVEMSADAVRGVDPRAPKYRLYDLRTPRRPSFSAPGPHPKAVSERLGHSSTAFTMDVYSASLPDMQEEAAEKLEAMLGGAAGR